MFQIQRSFVFYDTLCQTLSDFTPEKAIIPDCFHKPFIIISGL